MKTLSLFSGAGGLDIGFHRAGFDIIGCVEIEKQYCETIETTESILIQKLKFIAKILGVLNQKSSLIKK